MKLLDKRSMFIGLAGIKAARRHAVIGLAGTGTGLALDLSRARGMLLASIA